MWFGCVRFNSEYAIDYCGFWAAGFSPKLYSWCGNFWAIHIHIQLTHFAFIILCVVFDSIVVHLPTWLGHMMNVQHQNNGLHFSIDTQSDVTTKRVYCCLFTCSPLLKALHHLVPVLCVYRRIEFSTCYEFQHTRMFGRVSIEVRIGTIHIFNSWLCTWFTMPHLPNTDIVCTYQSVSAKFCCYKIMRWIKYGQK